MERNRVLQGATVNYSLHSHMHSLHRFHHLLHRIQDRAHLKLLRSCPQEDNCKGHPGAYCTHFQEVDSPYRVAERVVGSLCWVAGILCLVVGMMVGKVDDYLKVLSLVTVIGNKLLLSQ